MDLLGVLLILLGLIKKNQLIMDIKEIQHLIKFVAKSGAKEVKLEMEDVKITIKTGSDPVQIDTNSLVQQVQTVPSQAIITSSAPSAIENSKIEEKAAPEDDSLVNIKSPIIGTFYRKSAPDKPPFVQVGILSKKEMFFVLLKL